MLRLCRLMLTVTGAVFSHMRYKFTTLTIPSPSNSAALLLGLYVYSLQIVHCSISRI